MQDKKNDDYEVPHSPKKIVTITTEFKSGVLPIFWGPGQEYTGLYVEPKGIRPEFLRIPIICRFIHCNKSTTDTEEYREPEPPPPPNPGNLPSWWQITRITYREPPFPYLYVIYFRRYNALGPVAGSVESFFNTTYFIMVNGSLVNVGSQLSVGLRWNTITPAFGYNQFGINGPGWYTYSNGTLVNFF